MTASHDRLRGIFVETLLCFAALTALLAVVFGQALFELAAGGTPGMFDIKHYFVPMSFLFDTAIARGELPQWNPLTFCGTPFAANPQSATFYPPNFIRSVATPGVSPLTTYYGLILLGALQTILAGVGAYWLARSHRLGYLASFTAAVVFIFSAAYTRRLAELHFVPALVWLPFVWLAFRQMLNAERRSAKLFWAVGCGMMLGWSVLTGFVHLQVYVAVLLVGYWLLDRLLDPNGRPKRSVSATLASDAAFGLLIVGVALAIAAAMLVPAAEFAQHTYRAGEGFARIVEYAVDWPAIRTGLFGAGAEGTLSPYNGPILSAYFLAIVALFGLRRREAGVYLLLFIAIVDCSLGPPFPLASLVNAVSPFQIAHPDRVLALCGLPLGIAAAFGLQALANFTRTNNRARTVSVILVACVGLLWLSRFSASNIAPASVVGTALAAMLACWMPAAAYTRVFIVAVLLTETVVINHRYLPERLAQAGFIDIRNEQPNTDNPLTRNARRCDLSPNRHLYRLEPAINGYDPLYLGEVWRLLAPWQFNWSYQRVLQADDTVRDNPYPYSFIKRPFWLVGRYVRGSIPKADPPFPPTSVAFVDTETTLAIPEVTLADAVGEYAAQETVALGVPRAMEVSTMQDSDRAGAWELALPDRTAHAVLRLHYTAHCEGTIRVLLNESGELDALPIYVNEIDEDALGNATLDVPLPDSGAATVRITWESAEPNCAPEWLPAELLVASDDDNARIRIAEHGFDSVRVNIAELAAPRLLVFVDANYPGWTVTVDGEQRSVLTVNNAFKGVELGAGEHRVEFRFESRTVRWGLWVSIASVLTILLGLLSAIYRRRR